MFLSRIDGTLTSTAKHASLKGCRFLIGRRLEADGRSTGEPLVLLDRLGARHGSIVLVSTDGDVARQWLGDNTPARMIVVGIVDAVTLIDGAGRKVEAAPASFASDRERDKESP
ncbi:MAG: EutN/CcmL family microcompartment protein [Vicinamibacteria bacterium]|nr:EutN/CcmL family microcompartment protein [Vicinamibacteria bacterium]